MNYANKGHAAELLIEQANLYYRERGIALIHKVPTEWLPVRRNGQIVGAKIERKASVDFLGVWNGKPLAFDVKENSQPRWSLALLEPHQYAFLQGWQRGDGLSFILLVNNPTDTVHLMMFDVYDALLERARHGGRKSLNQTEIGELPVCRQSIGCACDYLKTLTEVM